MSKLSHQINKSTNKTKLTGVRSDKRFLLHHVKAFKDATTQILQTPWSSLVTCMIIAITLFFSTTLLVAIKSFQQVAEYINSANQLTVYLDTHGDSKSVLTLINRFKQDPLVKNVTYISPQQGLDELIQQSDLKNLLSQIETNPLPPVIQLKLNVTSKDKALEFSNNLKNIPLITSFNLDFEWLQRLSAIIKVGSRISYLLSIVFGLGVLIIISHTIEAASLKNKQEMDILRLIGATGAYIRRPFLYLGLLLGAGAGIIGTMLLLALFLSVKGPLVELLKTYNGIDVHLITPSKVIIDTLVLSLFLGWGGAWLAFYKYAKIR